MDIKDATTEELMEVLHATESLAVSETIFAELRRRSWAPPAFDFDEGLFAEDKS